MEDSSAPDAIRFEHQEHDVTCCLELICCGNTRLILGPEEAEFRKTSCGGVCNTNKRGPYGELGTVDIANVCCFVGFSATSLMPIDGETQMIGCGCEQDKVANIVAELKKRQAYRGDRAKIRLAETTLSSIKELNAKVDLILNHLDLAAPSAVTSTPVSSATMTR